MTARNICLPAFAALAFCAAGTLSTSSAAEPAKRYRLKGLYQRGARTQWGSECRGPAGKGLAFGGEDMDADDGRPHTRVLEGGAWKAVHEELRKENPGQQLYGQVWALRNLQKNAAAKARHIYFKGLPDDEETKRIKAELLPLQEKLVEDLDAAVAELERIMSVKDMAKYDAGQFQFVIGRLKLVAASAKSLVKETADGLSAEEIKKMLPVQISLELAAEALDAEPPPRALSPVVYDAKTGLYVIFGGDHFDYLTNDTWIFDPEKKKWQQRRPEGAPPPRAHHSLIAAGDGKVKLSGGYRYTSNTDYCGGQYGDHGDGEWVYDVEKNTWTGGGKLVSPDSREYRGGPFHPDFYLQGEKPDAAAFEAKLKSLPVNEWTATDPPYRPRLNRDWGTAIIDPGRDMILRWSGGHSAHGGTDVPHFHFSTNRWEMPYPVEFPLDCLYSNTTYPQGFNFNLRPWITGHTYQGYDYDPPSKKMVMTGRPRNFYVYDPDLADWTARGAKPKGMAYNSCFYTLTVCPTPNGAICWTNGGKLFLYESAKSAWSDIETSGDALPGAQCDRSGSSYDPKRDRVLFLRAERKQPFDGQVYALDMKTREVKKLNPAGAGGVASLAGGCVRETCYDLANDMLIVGSGLLEPDRSTAAYDCEKNRWVSLQLTGYNPADPKKRGTNRNISMGLMYDAKRELIWATDTNSQVYVLRLDAETAAKPLE